MISYSTRITSVLSEKCWLCWLRSLQDITSFSDYKMSLAQQRSEGIISLSLFKYIIDQHLLSHDAVELQFLSSCFCASCAVCQLLSLYQSDMQQNVLLIKLQTRWNVKMLSLTYERPRFFFFQWFALCVSMCVCSKWPCHLVVPLPS